MNGATVRAALLAATVVCVGCGNDDEGGGGSGLAGGTGGTAGTGGASGAGGMAGTGGTGGQGLVVEVAWQPILPCQAMVASDWQVEVTTDGGTPPLEIMGFVSGCPMGQVTQFVSAMTTFECPNFSTYSGGVNVTDSDGKAGAVTFMFGNCTPGNAP